MLPDRVVDLSLPPEQRWQFADDERQAARELLQTYRKDLGIGSAEAESLVEMALPALSDAHAGELRGIAARLDMPFAEVLVANLYYDALKTVIGCTAFAVDTQDSVLHARNLDWWTEGDALRRFSMRTDFRGAPAGEFTTIGWPGLAGVFSGVASGRFAVTLNSVLSEDPFQLGVCVTGEARRRARAFRPAIPPRSLDESTDSPAFPGGIAERKSRTPHSRLPWRRLLAEPVVFLLRRALETAKTFDDAVVLLTEAAIPCDCLLLVTGTTPGEMVVIERTPARAALRRPEHGSLFVTNDYRALEAPGFEPESSSELRRTSCGRYERVEQLVRQNRPVDAATCLRYLGDDEVRMNITVQQMVFEARSGSVWSGDKRP